jgi:hypothetical protein
MQGSADSLNVSVSMAVLAYEALRQRTQDPPPMTKSSINRCYSQVFLEW